MHRWRDEGINGWMGGGMDLSCLATVSFNSHSPMGQGLLFMFHEYGKKK